MTDIGETFLPYLNITAIPVTARDRITIVANNQKAALTIRIGARLLTTDGKLVDMQIDRAVAHASNPTIADITLHDGYLIGISVNDQVGTIKPGELWIELALSVGRAPAGRQWLHLVHGYVARYQSLSWPQIPQPLIGEGCGTTQGISLASPAAGADFVYTHQAAFMGRLKCVSAKLACDANVATRLPNLEIYEPSGGLIFKVRHLTGTTANQTVYFAWNINACDSNDQSTDATVRPLPPITLGEDFEIHSQTDNLQVGDQWSEILVTCEQLAGEVAP